jgi:hypothetical protein
MTTSPVVTSHSGPPGNPCPISRENIWNAHCPRTWPGSKKPQWFTALDGDL